MKTVTITLTLPEAIKLMAACNAAIELDEASMDNINLMHPNYTKRKEMTENSINMFTHLKKKISEACAKE